MCVSGVVLRVGGGEREGYPFHEGYPFLVSVSRLLVRSDPSAQNLVYTVVFFTSMLASHYSVV